MGLYGFTRGGEGSSPLYIKRSHCSPLAGESVRVGVTALSSTCVTESDLPLCSGDCARGVVERAKEESANRYNTKERRHPVLTAQITIPANPPNLPIRLDTQQPASSKTAPILDSY